jgi:hypothetical protein
MDIDRAVYFYSVKVSLPNPHICYQGADLLVKVLLHFFFLYNSTSSIIAFCNEVED